MCFSLVQAHCSRTLLITAVLNTSWSFKRNGACSMGRTLWAVLSITKGVVAARWQWQRLLGCSGPWHSGPITISEGKKTTKKNLTDNPQSAGGVRCHLLAGLIDPGRTVTTTSHEWMPTGNYQRSQIVIVPCCLLFSLPNYSSFFSPLWVCVCYPNVVLFSF